jgi:hypothetical protein
VVLVGGVLKATIAAGAEHKDSWRIERRPRAEAVDATAPVRPVTNMIVHKHPSGADALPNHSALNVPSGGGTALAQGFIRPSTRRNCRILLVCAAVPPSSAASQYERQACSTPRAHVALGALAVAVRCSGHMVRGRMPNGASIPHSVVEKGTVLAMVLETD